MMAVVESRVSHSRTLKKQTKNDRGFPGGPGVTTLYCRCRCVAVIPYRGTIPHAAWPKKKEY